MQDLPEIRALQIEMIQNGYGDAVEVANAHLEIDTAAMKTAALSVYGMLEQAHHDVLPPSIDILGFFTPEPGTWFLRNAPGTYALEELRLQVHDEMLEIVGHEWEGDAYEEFKAYMDKLRSVMGMEAERLRTIGSALYHVAIAIRRPMKRSKPHSGAPSG